mgnify:CR=1 FL=1
MKSNKIYLEHIKSCLDEIDSYDLSYEKLTENSMVYNATLRVLQVMTESLTKLSDDLKARNKIIDWAKIKGFRNIVVHEYLGNLDHDILWNIISYELHDIRKIVDKEL